MKFDPSLNSKDDQTFSQRWKFVGTEMRLCRRMPKPDPFTMNLYRKESSVERDSAACLKYRTFLHQFCLNPLDLLQLGEVDPLLLDLRDQFKRQLLKPHQTSGHEAVTHGVVLETWSMI
jgi:hypothetical protein